MADVKGNELLARDTFMTQLYIGGTRITDIMALRLGDVWRGGRFKESVVITARKTDDANEFPIAEELKLVLMKYLTSKKPDDFVFPWLKGMEEEPSVEVVGLIIKKKTALMNKELKGVVKKVGIYKAVKTHTARRSLAAILLKKGVDIREIQAVLGHKTLEITEKYLAKLSNKHIKNAISVVSFKRA